MHKSDKKLLICEARNSKLVVVSKPEELILSITSKSEKLSEKLYPARFLIFISESGSRSLDLVVTKKGNHI